MDERVQAIIDEVLGRLRAGVGRAWVEPERVRLTITAKTRPARGLGAMYSLAVELDTPGGTLRVERATGLNERISTRPA